MTMDNHRILLTLSYFNQTGKNYSIGELMGLLGLNSSQLDDLLINIKGKTLIAYSDGLLKITEKGLLKLISSNFEDYDFHENEYLVDNINKTKSISTDTPYIPKNFLSKI